MATAKKGKKIEFEKSLAELEALVEDMEAGELSLEESLKAFEKGMKLSRDCQQALAEAEQKVQVLLAEGGDNAEPQYTDFVDDDSGSAE